MSTRPPPRRPPVVPDDDPAERRARARAELQRRGFLRADTERDPEVLRSPSGAPVERRAAPRPRGGVAVVAYRRPPLPGDSTSDGPVDAVSRPDPSYSDQPDAATAPYEQLDLDPDTGEAQRVGGGDEQRPAPPLRRLLAEITEPGADPVRVTRDALRVYLDREHLACLLGIVVGLSLLAGAGLASLVYALAVLRSPV